MPTIKTAAILCGVILLAGHCSGVVGQALDEHAFKAIRRPINYATPLAPKEGAKALIVYGKTAPWTQEAAAAVQKAIEDWSGVKLDMATTARSPARRPGSPTTPFAIRR